MNKATSAEDFKLSSSFEQVRKTLLDDKFEDRLEKPLAYWALPNDRRLPLAFLGRPLGDLLRTPFEELSSTPGIGQKKIGTLVKLLHRATKDHPPAVPFGIDELTSEEEIKQQQESAAVKGSRFDPAIVSEALWSQWCETVRRHGVGVEKLGRLAPSLSNLPTVIWHKQLGEYLDHTVAEIRSKKTHGEKRVRVVLEVFCVVHEALHRVDPPEHLSVRLSPSFVPPIEAWVRGVLSGSGAVSEAELRENLAVPLLDQIKTDAGETVHTLAEGRLGIQGAPQSVRMQSRKMGVTRARVYQLLEECAKVMEVRWPEGRRLLAELGDKLAEGESGDIALFNATRELFFPEKTAVADTIED